MQIKWTKLALSDIEHAYEYVAAENLYAADAVIDRIEHALVALAVHPNMGRRGRCKGTRELIISSTPFIIAYRVQKNIIEIVAVMHHARMWPEAF